MLRLVLDSFLSLLKITAARLAGQSGSACQKVGSKLSLLNNPNVADTRKKGQTQQNTQTHKTKDTS